MFYAICARACAPNRVKWRNLLDVHVCAYLPLSSLLCHSFILCIFSVVLFGFLTRIQERDMNCFATYFAFDKSVCRCCRQRQFSVFVYAVHYVVRMSNLFNCVSKKRTFFCLSALRSCFFSSNTLFQSWLFSFLFLSIVSYSSSTVHVRHAHVVIHMTLVASLFLDVLSFVNGCCDAKFWMIIRSCTQTHAFKNILRLWLTDEIIYRRMTKFNNCTFS